MLFEQDTEMELRLDWADICKIACACFIRKMTFNQFVVAAVEERLVRGVQ